MNDFTITNHGTIYLFRPHTLAAEKWIEEHIPEDAPYHGNCLAVEHRFAGAIIDGITNDGLNADII